MAVAGGLRVGAASLLSDAGSGSWSRLAEYSLPEPSGTATPVTALAWPASRATPRMHGLIRAHKDGHVERLPAIPDVPCTWGSTAASSGVLARDVVVDRAMGVWARLYAPAAAAAGKVPVVVYFHGGGFCVGSSAWSCYHEFLAQLPARAGCAVMSVDYRLAPENRLSAAFDDGLAAVRWLQQQAGQHGRNDEVAWWRSRCRFDRVFLMGDSAGATIAFHVAARLGQGQLGALAPLSVKGAILIQPFFGGESRTASEKTMPQPRSALSLSTSDSYWQMALPAGAGRDHQWCNPLSRGAPRLETVPLPPVLVCVAEADILREAANKMWNLSYLPCGMSLHVCSLKHYLRHRSVYSLQGFQLL